MKLERDTHYCSRNGTKIEGISAYFLDLRNAPLELVMEIIYFLNLATTVISGVNLILVILLIRRQK